MITEFDVIIIGGGVSGLFAAAACPPGTKGLLIDHAKKPGKKLLMSGGGQCNITHGGSIKDFVNHYGDNSKKLRSVLYKHNNLALIDFFESRGLSLLTRSDGKVFPKSMEAKQVLNILVTETKSNGFQWLPDLHAETIFPLKNDDVDFNKNSMHYKILCKHRGFGSNALTQGKGCLEGIAEDIALCCKRLIIATGGCSYPTTGSDGSMFRTLTKLGLNVVTPTPALSPIAVDKYPYRELSGVSFSNVELSIYNGSETIRTQAGDLLFTHTHLSGPVILNSARFISQGSHISLNYFPGKDRAILLKELKAAVSGNAKQIDTVLYQFARRQNKTISASFLSLLIERAGFMPEQKASTLSGGDLEKLLLLLTKDWFVVSGLAGWNNAMVTAGGVDLEEMDLKTMECKKFPGMYIIGEALDVDGDTGGYNIQFAYSSAMAAVSDLTCKL